MDEAECSLEWNRPGENARTLKNPVPLAAVRPLTFGASDTINDLNRSYDCSGGEFVRVSLSSRASSSSTLREA